jgi:DNA gyrase subunit B
MEARQPGKTLNDIEAVQKRPGMYVGATDDGSGLHEMAFEVAVNAIKEGIAGYCSRIGLTLAVNGSVTVSDDGRGLPVHIEPRGGVSKAEMIMTRVSPGLGWEPGLDVPDALYGVGVYVVNALSAWLDLRVWRDGAEHFMRFHEGHPVAPLQVVGGSNGKRGTEITFLPNPKVFVGTSFDFTTLERRFRMLTVPRANVTLALIDKRGVDRKEAIIEL